MTVRSPRIDKSAAARAAANVGDYEAACAAFRWDDVRAALGVPGDRINIATLAVDRHASGPRRDHVALRWLGKDGARRDLTYADLSEHVDRAANALLALGVARGDRVFALLGRVPELYALALATLKIGAVFSPLFSAFGPEPVETRLRLGGGRVLVTSRRLYERKVAPVRARLPELRHVLLVDGRDDDGDTRALGPLLAIQPATAAAAATGAEDLALLHFTSGTTGTPKGAMHVHGAALMHWHSARVALDLHADDVYWCTADPGWVTGTSYGILAPLLHGVTMVVDEAEFDAERWYRILANERVTVWYTAPTAIRMLMKLGAPGERRRLPDLRFIGSVGEPLNPEAVWWGQDTFGLAIHDNWWQTETGGIMIANLAAAEIRPGSMGRPLPGIEAAIVRVGDAGLTVLDAPDQQGELALRPGWPSMFRGYLNEDERYRTCFVGGWYLSGDLARRDADGYFWFVGRGSDVIKSSGHLIGPFEVESALMQHPAVAEAGVIGIPDAVAGEVVKAFVALKTGYAASDELRDEIVGTARRLLGPAVAPRLLDIVPQLPKTRSGKIMRRLLKARELGLPEGDLSTLEGRE